VCPRAGLDAVSETKIPSPRLDWNPDRLIVQLVVSRYTVRRGKIATSELNLHRRENLKSRIRNSEASHDDIFSISSPLDPHVVLITLFLYKLQIQLLIQLTN